MSSRMRRPETVKLDITRGDWLLVKKHLTAGEQRGIFKRMMMDGLSGPHMDPVKVGVSKIVGYLLDWSITDADDKPVPIRDQPEEAVIAALDALESDSFAEILKAVEDHETAMEQARAAEKNGQGGESKSVAISPSPESLAGATSGSLNLTATSTLS